LVGAAADSPPLSTLQAFAFARSRSANFHIPPTLIGSRALAAYGDVDGSSAERLAALVPRPRLHLIRFHGVLAPNAKLRSKIIPTPPEPAAEPSNDHAHAHRRTVRMSWARLLKRVFDIDIEHCPNCGAALKIIAAIEDPPVIVKILTHLGLPTRAPPRAPAQRFDLFQTT
jgi:hypothetical protein